MKRNKKENACAHISFRAEIVFTEMKTIYGANNCFLLQMNSRPPGLSDDNTHLPDPWSQFLTKHTELSGGSEQSSSPRTPADIGGVSAMPSEVTMESDKYVLLRVLIRSLSNEFLYYVFSLFCRMWQIHFLKLKSKESCCQKKFIQVQALECTLRCTSRS